MEEIKILVSNSRNVRFVRFSELDIYVCKRIDRGVWENRNGNRSYPFGITFVVMHMRTYILVACGHFLIDSCLVGITDKFYSYKYTFSILSVFYAVKLASNMDDL